MRSCVVLCIRKESYVSIPLNIFGMSGNVFIPRILRSFPLSSLEFAMYGPIFLCDWSHMGFLSIHGRRLFWIILYHGIVPHFMWNVPYFVWNVPYFVWDYTSLNVGLYLILCGTVPHFMWNCTYHQCIKM